MTMPPSNTPISVSDAERTAREAAERSRLTFRQDRIRGACNGILEAGVLTFGLVVAIRYFDASSFSKAMVASANACGLLLTPVSLFLYVRLGWTAARAATLNFALGALFLLAATTAPTLGLFVPAHALGALFLAQQAPLLIHIYTANYAAHRRGRMLSNSIILSLITAVGFSTLGGRAMDTELESYRMLYSIMVVAAITAGWAVSRMPAEPFVPTGNKNPLAALRFVRGDRVFRSMLFVWMIMGVGNLMMLPLRIDYMANPIYGINASNAQIAVITVVVPSLVRLATTHLWGRFFDRHDFFIIRTILNGFSFAAILLFFSSHSLWLLSIAAGLFGLAMAGGNIAWNLWVTKFAPPSRTSDYMSVHTFFTGIRGVGAPFLGFWLIGQLGAVRTSLIAAGLIGLSMVLLDPLRRKHRHLNPRSN